MRVVGTAYSKRPNLCLFCVNQLIGKGQRSSCPIKSSENAQNGLYSRVFYRKMPPVDQYCA